MCPSGLTLFSQIKIISSCNLSNKINNHCVNALKKLRSWQAIECKFHEIRAILSAQSAEESIAGIRKAKSFQWKELNNLY